MTIDATRARTFVYGNGRLLEQRVWVSLFEGGDPAAVVRAVVAYQNEDGGFGHGLEPDKRAPGSQPLDVDIALERLVTVGVRVGDTAGVTSGTPVDDLVARACDFLTSVSDPAGAVPVLLPSIAGYPRASHWAETDDYPPDLNPTANIAGHLYALGASHPWLDAASEWCFSVLEGDGMPVEAHALLAVACFVEHAPDRDRAAPLGDALAKQLPTSNWFQEMPDPENYGVTPLEFAPSPASPARSWFDDLAIEAHLDALEGNQQADGGWPISWDAPSDASRCDWRAIRTLQAVRVLEAYGRL
jgi:hypothetical protein